MTRRRRILVTLESRATFGYSTNVIRTALAEPALEVQTLVTGMHLMPELGDTVQTLYRANLPVSATVPLCPGPGAAGWPRAMGHAIAGFAEAYEKLAPDIVLVSGDRGETFALAVAAVYMGLPVAHIQAGDKSGHIDDAARMAMAKLVHVHLAPGKDAVERLTRLGEQPFRIHDTGAPQLDDMVGRSFDQKTIDIDGRPFDLARPFLLLLQHPVLAERDEAEQQIEASLRACLAHDMPVVWIYPNSDQGFRDILNVIEREKGTERLFVVANLERDDYLTLLANCTCLVGNSSSGILEAPTLRVPVINVGNRQRGRPQASNIINCGHDEVEIEQAIRAARENPAFRAACARAVNPFGDGRSAQRIVRILHDVKIDSTLLDKQTTY